MRSAVTLCLAFAASALAYQVISPSASQGWNNNGAQLLTWEKVSTDADTFTAVLVNDDRSVLPQNNQVLAAQVDGSLGNTTVNPPSGGWPIGDGFRVNLVQNVTELNTILAQSPEFSITAVSVSSTASSTSGTSRTVASNTGASTSTDPSATSAGAADTTSGSASPSSTHNSAVALTAQTGFIGALALAGALFA